MTITNINEVDGLAVDEDKNELILLITDALGWENQQQHLDLLLKKINNYLSFIDTKQYSNIYPDCNCTKFLIKINFKNDVPPVAVDFINYIYQQIKSEHIRIEMEVTG